MNQKQRQVSIMEKINHFGSLSTQELVTIFGVSKMTIGRDLKELAKQNKIELFHGGAMSKDGKSLEDSMDMKADLFVTDKMKIGEKAAHLISEETTIFLGTGTTVLYAAQALTQKKNCIYYTNSLLIANYFSKINALNWHMVPGEYRELSQGFIGLATQQYIAPLFFDFCIIGTEGVAATGRVSLYNESEALMQQAILKQSKQSILVFDQSKIGKNLLYQMGDLSSFTHVLTNYKEIGSFLNER